MKHDIVPFLWFDTKPKRQPIAHVGVRELAEPPVSRYTDAWRGRPGP